MAGLPLLAKNTVARVKRVPNGHTDMLPVKMARLGRLFGRQTARPAAWAAGLDHERNCWWHWPHVPIRAWADAV